MVVLDASNQYGVTYFKEGKMILETERLILRPWEEKDAHDLFHIFGLCKKWKSWEIKSRASFGLSEKNNSGQLN